MSKLLKGVLAALTGILILTVTSCVLITVSSANTYNETYDSSNNASSENTEKTLNGSDWIQINGNFDSASDVDYYLVTVPAGTTHIAVNVKHNGVDVLDSIIGAINDFPLDVYFLNNSLSIVGTTQLAAASGDGITVDDSSTRYLRVAVSASSLLGVSYTSGTYSVQLQ